MKTNTYIQNRLMLIFFSALLLFGATSCYKYDNMPCIRPRGPVLTEEIIVEEPVNIIELRMHADVIIKNGPVANIVIHAPENLLNYITTQISGNELTIGQSRCIRARSSDIVIEITTNHISSVSISGSGKIFISDVFESEAIRLAVSGSGRITGHLKGNEIDAIISGSGRIELSGEFQKQRTIISGSGEVRNMNLFCQNAEVRISGSGNAYINVNSHLHAIISGSGKIYYYGNPDISYTITGSGRLIRAD